VLGATSLGGRPAGAGSTLVGVLLLAVLFNAFNPEGSIGSYWQWVLRGALLVAAVALQHRVSRRPG
jgi:ribose/xylose/arabinose/galactoside ABC-type transport system permease subunit